MSWLATQNNYLSAADRLDSANRPASALVLRRLVGWKEAFWLSAGKKTQRLSAVKPRGRDIRVAYILDEFSANSFKGCFQGEPLLPQTWREQFERLKPQIFFCESAWTGSDPVARPWRGRIYASENFAMENRGVLLDILAHCRAKGIPTVFWNKEDPTHYDDRKHDFVKTAAAFDLVFTTAVECVPRYRADHGVKNAYALPFATNPVLFNPIDVGPRSDAVVFAGSWYANHVERSAQMRAILDQLLLSGYELEIFDRYSGGDDPLHQWPEGYAPYIRPAVPHDQIAAVYKRSRFGLNFNTVVESQTMFARRVFELMSSHTLVLSNYSPAMAAFFGEEVVFCDREPARLRDMTSAEVDDLRSRALNRVLAQHSYLHRWEEILNKAGLAFQSELDPAITVVVRIASPAEALQAIGWFQTEATLGLDRLLLLVAEEVSGLETARLYQEFNRFGVGVTAERHVYHYAMHKRYCPVETPDMLAVALSSLPRPGWLRRARLHRQYVTAPITEARAHPPYGFFPVEPDQPLLVQARALESNAQGASGAEGEMYHV